MIRLKLWIPLLMLAAAVGCGPSAPPPPPAAAVPEGEPPRITVQHVLIAFRGAKDAPPEVTRSREEAGKFARELLERVRQGEDIDLLSHNHSTDPGGGKYTLVNSGRDPAPGEIRRSAFIKPFVNVAFKLKVGEAGIAEHDEKEAPYGWHVIKRLE